MNTKKQILAICLLIATAVSTTGCQLTNTMEDGYYTAEMSDFSHGWKEYVCIQVKNDAIVSAEYNAKNMSGFIKSWDNNYMKNMKGVQGTYPNKYTREYVQQLIDGQKDAKIDTITGATNSGNNFIKLVAAVIEQAKAGDSTVVSVESAGEE